VVDAVAGAFKSDGVGVVARAGNVAGGMAVARRSLVWTIVKRMRIQLRPESLWPHIYC
jgi:hypothetical protein